MRARGVGTREVERPIQSWNLQAVHETVKRTPRRLGRDDVAGELLEQVRLLSNLETDDRKLLQIVLMGQPELRDRLNNCALRQLRQRITVRYHLSPLKRAEVGEYVQHRLAVSGSKGAPRFTLGALWRVYCYSQGIPRLVNAVCDKCLLAGFVQQRARIDYALVGRAIRELEGTISI